MEENAMKVKVLVFLSIKMRFCLESYNINSGSFFKNNLHECVGVLELASFLQIIEKKLFHEICECIGCVPFEEFSKKRLEGLLLEVLHVADSLSYDSTFNS